MTGTVLTPITQAINDGTLTRRELKGFMRRSNGPALLRLALWLPLLVAGGLLVSFAEGSLFFVPAMFLQGVLLVHLFALQHECCHYTVYRHRWLNDLTGALCGLVILLPHQFFRYEHCDHHTFTQLKGQDPELIPLPASLGGYLWYLSGIPYWWGLASALVRHTAGHLNAEEQRFVPKEVRGTIVSEARAYAAVYLAILTLSLAYGWTWPIWLWWAPMLMAQPVMRAIRMTEHVGRPNVPDMTRNTRSNLVSAPWRFLCWNMNYHAEHHYAASVPFHALPKLHEKLKGHVHVQPGGYLGAHREILAQLLGRQTRADKLA